MKNKNIMIFIGIVFSVIVLILSFFTSSKLKIEYFNFENGEIEIEVEKVKLIDHNLQFTYQGKEYTMVFNREDQIINGMNYKLIFEGNSKTLIQKSDVTKLLKQKLKSVNVIEDCGDSCPVK